MSVRRLSMLVAVLFALSAGSLQAADGPNDAAALKGVTMGKVVFDIATPKPETLVVLLTVVRETYDDLVAQKIVPQMVLAIRGAPVKAIKTNRDELPLESYDAYERINDILDDLAKRPGVRIEVCSISTRMLGVENARIKPAFHVVGNTWVSLIGYQARGYAVIPLN
ncbi:MAG: DsrE family protein [Alphaproteobacteria bacterium]|nr:DsrE family protein [Alphaproteobacteria bacterium]